MSAPSGLVKSNSLTSTAVLVVPHACIVTAIRAMYPSMAADGYIQLFDASATTQVTVGTTVPDWVVLNDFGSGEVTTGDGLPVDGLVFTKGVVAASTTLSTNSTSATQHLRLGIR